MTDKEKYSILERKYKIETESLQHSLHAEQMRIQTLTLENKSLKEQYAQMEKKYTEMEQGYQKRLTEGINLKIAEEVKNALDKQALGYEEQLAKQKKKK